MSNKQSSVAISYEQLQRAAYLNYLDRVSKGLPGCDAEDWEKARVHLECQINQPETTPKSKASKESAKSSPATKTEVKPKAKGKAKDKKSAKPASKAGPESLKVLDGLGPKIESRLHEAGVTSLKQIASWKKKDVEAISKKLKLGTRIAREKWVEQAKALVKK